jgi:hypothetical protein
MLGKGFNGLCTLSLGVTYLLGSGLGCSGMSWKAYCGIV